MNSNKRFSEENGHDFLRRALALEQQVLSKQLELSRYSITHNGRMGEVNEQLFIDLLRRYLPRRYGVQQAIVIDSQGNTSDQIDIVIFDQQYTPPLLRQMSHCYILAEAVYCVLEVKPAINRQYLIYAADKARSVRKLVRTSTAIIHAADKKRAEPKEPFPILSGIVGIHSGWEGGLNSPFFQQTINQLLGDQTLTLGLAMEDLAFERSYPRFEHFMPHGKLTLSPSENSLAWFLFTLLKRLQDLGTCPAVDWLRYREVLAPESQVSAPEPQAEI